MGKQIEFADGSGSIYVITRDGDLLWYGDVHRDGTPGWAANSGNRIGWGWQDVRLAFSGGDGIIYSIKNNGDLLWYRDVPRDGTVGWAANSGNRIGEGWQDVRLAFSGGDGIIYGIKNNGDLLWYRDVPRNGTQGWAANSGNQIGSGWRESPFAFSGGNGIIYGIKNNGDLLWYQDVRRDGTQGWAANSGNQIGSGWQTVQDAISGDGGVIYAIDAVGRLLWYRDLHRDGTQGWAPRSGDAIGAGWTAVEWNPSLTAFGHLSMLQQGRPALGPRRLLIVLVEYDNDPADNFPPFSATHPLDYYEKLGFGVPDPPFATSGPVNPASLMEYFRECSLGRFWLTRADMVGPVSMGPLDDPGPEARSQRILARVAAFEPRMFFDADTDGNSVITPSEFLVLVVENAKALQPANRDNLAVVARIDVAFPPLVLTKTISLHVAFAGPLTPFYQIAHETSHSLGTVDLYNSGAGNSLLTLMGGYSFFSNDQGSVHLDAWHKLALGWCEPRRRRLTRAGDEQLVEISPQQPNGAIILWHPDRGASEYFLVERRAASGQRKYDGSFPGDGALIWRITSGPNPATHLGSTDFALGASTVWQAGMQTPPLPWSDNTSTGVRLAFTRGFGNNLRVTWS
jgi:M6 family metalloprotease-like protein